MKPKPLSIDGPERDRLLPLLLGKIATDGPESCWEWLGAIHPLGYRQWKILGRTHRRRVTSSWLGASNGTGGPARSASTSTSVSAYGRSAPRTVLRETQQHDPVAVRAKR